MINKSEITPKSVSYSQNGNPSHNNLKHTASITVEAALVIPIFIIVMMSLSSIIYVIYSDTIIKKAVYEEAKYMSMLSYDNSEYGIDVMKGRIISRIGDRVINSAYVDKDMGGIDFSDSDLSNREIIDISVNYNVRIPYDILGVLRYRYKERVVMHTLTGYVNGLNGINNDSETVYISETGSVYHRSINCSHIRLNVIETSASEIKSLRNDNGAKYKSCGTCHSSIGDAKMYITTDGTKYHNTLMCSGIKRNIREIPLTCVMDRRPCSRCGY